MDEHFWAVATDYDGTLTLGGRPEPSVLDAIARARALGRKLLLVTGRVLSHLQGEFPDVLAHFDAVVAENGCVVASGASRRLLAEPISQRLDVALAERGVHFGRGEVLVDCLDRDARVVEAELERLEIAHRLVRNRESLMILPAGVSKATGLLAALGELGVSPAGVVGVGDAENDLALLEACGLGAAVANAIPALRARADLILARPAGEGIVELLDRLWLADGPPLPRQR